MKPIIKVTDLSKQYRIGVRDAAYGTLRESVMSMLSSPLRLLSRPASDNGDHKIWALNNVCFEIMPGEVVGIIGRNGAGKSTLLKILSRITEPTTGKIELFGRVGSLLEVGTGFHAELTGRENIFLNGSILGMTRKEIEARFDEIVEFAEIEKFIDTPVKRYSSGMYLRLAFAVAAYLEPEILIIDEVLAVGDAAFQKKCLGKMSEVAREGRTVLFVSHNMGAIQRLCTRALLVDQGRVIKDATASEAIHFYLRSGLDQQGQRVWDNDGHRPGFRDGTVQFESIKVSDSAGNMRTEFDVKEPVVVEVQYRVLRSEHVLNVHLYFHDETGETIFVSMDNLDSPWQETPAPEGLYRAVCEIPANLLNEGLIRVEYLICTRPTTPTYATYPDAISFRMTDDMKEDGARGNWIREWPMSVVRPRLKWSVEQLAQQ